MKRIIRNRHLTPEEAAKYDDVRKKVAAELPDLIKRHQERATSESKPQTKAANDRQRRTKQ